MRGPLSPVSSSVIALLLLRILNTVSCSGMFELRLENFANDYGRDADGSCCSGVKSSSGMCSGTCRTRFRICLKHYQATIDPNPPCTYGELLTPVLGNNSVHLGPMTDPQSGFTNPIVFAFEFSWLTTFSLIVEAWHESEPNSAPGGGRKLITRLAIQRWLDVSQEWTQDSHRTNHTAITYSIRVRCMDNYYGNNCATLCRPRNDKFGHYTCSPAGNKVCLRGWSGEYCTTAVCAPGCHIQHGYCDQPDECKCRLGWQGPLCDQCIRYPGCLRGTCNQPWQCNCDEGWGGLFCNQDLNYCTNHKPCKHGGTCTNTGQGSYTCTCADGYTGTNCEEEVDDCVHKPCLNGGSCKGVGKNYTCQCPLGFFGRHCETAASTCTENPCKNSGTCVDGPSGYLCVCPPAFEGSNCEKQKNLCEPNPCRNGGSCAKKSETYQCSCPIGFSGDQCQNDIDDCVVNPCLNGGSCVDDVNSFRCACVPGFVGSLCQANVDDCLLKPCSNGGTCHDLVNDYLCDCRSGFAGKDCSSNVDDCQSSPCLNGGTCEDLVGEFLCHCTSGFHGDLCQKTVGVEAPTFRQSNVAAAKAFSFTSTTTQRSVVNKVRPNHQVNPTTVLEIAHQVSVEDHSDGDSDKNGQVALIATLSVVIPVLLLLLVVLLLFLRRRQKQKREDRRLDAEICKQQNEPKCMNNKCVDKHIVNNTLGRTMMGPKSLKVNNEGQDSSIYQRGEDPVLRTKSTKLLNTDCTCNTRASKMLDSDLMEHDCAPRTFDRRDSLQQLPPSKSESSLYPSLDSKSCSKTSVFVIDDHFPPPCPENLLATEV